MKESDTNRLTIPNRERLENWVGEFLSYWEDSNMLATEAAEVIVNEIFKVYPCLGDLNQNDLYQLQDPESFFEAQEG